MGTMRLDKFLVEMKKGSRSEVKKLIKSGRVTVDGQTVSYASFEYFMLNKPQGVVSATEDRRFQTVVDLIDTARRKDLFPAGRLDIDTEGLLLITNDGQLAHQLLSPKKHVDKVYFARVEGILPSDVKEQFAKGLTLDGDVKTLPARLELLKEGPVSEVRLTIHEGKFHQVKRMFEAVGCRVIYLKRLSMGSLVLDETLAPGEYRRLTDDELCALKGEEVSSLENSSPLAGKKAFLFDLDGTLVDSMWMWGAIDVEYLGKFGLTCPPDLQKAIEGMSFSETAAYFKKRFALEASLEEIKADWVSMSIEKYRSQVPPKPGTEAFLSWAAKQNIKMAVCTSNGREMVDAVLSSLNLARYFDCIITGCEVAAGKPSPDIYLEAARRMKVSPEECAVFEDVPAGILAGKRAGMEVFAVEDEYSLGMEEEKRALSDFYIRDYRELTP